MGLSEIYPSKIKIKYDYIEVDVTNCVAMHIEKIPNKMECFENIDILTIFKNSIVAFDIRKQDIRKEIAKLTEVIADTRAEIKMIGGNQRDIESLKDLEQKAVNLRREIQLKNESIFGLRGYLLAYNQNINLLNENVRKIQTKLYSRGYLSKIANFRHQEAYKRTLPILINNKKENFNTVIGSEIARWITIYNSNLIHEKGVLYGVNENKICIYDIFDNGNLNYNMFVIGGSGAGKSYFIKLLLLRHLCMGIRQIIIDVEGEYENIVIFLGGKIITQENINVLFIPEDFAKKNIKDFLIKKIEQIITIVEKEVNINEKERVVLKEEIKSLYKKHGITTNLQSLYIKNDISLEKQYRKESDYPNLLNLISQMENKKERKELLKKLVKNKIFKYVSKTKRKESNEDTLILFKVDNYSSDYIDLIFYYIEQYYGKKLLIYIDEMWKLITRFTNYNIKNRILELFKTVRKRNAGIIAITQDISDFISDSGGDFGKGIVNNSFTKIFFKLEYIDVESLYKIGIIDNEKIENIKMLSRGEAFMTVGNEYMNIKIEANKMEKRLIGGNFEQSNSSIR
ncbi:MAG: DUF87 domain-containing protein [Clostridia bacterium]|nr:DUF87 domain-containing protein [Clostridia bacterium]